MDGVQQLCLRRRLASCLKRLYMHTLHTRLRQDSRITKGKNIVIVTLILRMRATKHYVTSFQFLGSAVASKKTINCVWMIVKKLPCTEFERANREN